MMLLMMAIPHGSKDSMLDVDGNQYILYVSVSRAVKTVGFRFVLPSRPTQLQYLRLYAIHHKLIVSI